METKTALTLFLAVSVLSGCIRVEDSPAPGCVKYIGPAPMGGCFGKSVITDFKIEPNVSCLKVRVNNCNGGILDVTNNCGEKVSIEGYEVGNGYSTLELTRGKDGRIAANHTAGNFASYNPIEDDLINARGSVGDTSISLSCNKTKPLC